MKNGFSLVEMLVAMTVFSLTVGAILGLSVAAIRSQAEALRLQKLLDETSYVTEYMSRDLRMAKKDTTAWCLSFCGAGCNYETMGVSAINFVSYRDECKGYYRDVLNASIMHVSPLFPLTSSKVNVSSLRFTLSGESQNETPNLQPRITISMTIGKAGVAKPEIKIQTTISQRNLDIVQ